MKEEENEHFIINRNTMLSELASNYTGLGMMADNRYKL